MYFQLPPPDRCEGEEGGAQREGEGGRGLGDRLCAWCFYVLQITMYIVFPVVDLISSFHCKRSVLTRGEAQISIHYYYYNYY